jgi:hypothetical protein
MNMVIALIAKSPTCGPQGRRSINLVRADEEYNRNLTESQRLLGQGGAPRSVLGLMLWVFTMLALRPVIISMVG